MTEETRGRSFDALAKGLASGDVSRGKALKLMGAALLGGLLASTPTLAEAKPKDNKCINDKQCPAGTTCVNNVCVTRTGPNRISCYCQDGTQIDTCTSADCASGIEQDQVCNPLCASHGGLEATGCLIYHPQCYVSPSPNPNLLGCTCQNGTYITTCTSVSCYANDIEKAEVCNALCASNGGLLRTDGCIPEEGYCVAYG
jgi:hypothetical protein